MKLKDKIKPAIPPLPSGTYPAVCVGVVDIGDQYNKTFQNCQRKVSIVFEIPSESILVDGQEQPRQLSKRYTFSVKQNSNLYTLLNGWLNANMDESSMQEVDLFSLIGRCGFVSVSISKDGQYNNIDNVMAFPKGIPPLQSNTPAIRYDMDVDGFEGEVWDGLPDWVKNAVQKSKQYQEFAPDMVLPAPPNEEKPVDTATPQKQETAHSNVIQEETPVLSGNAEKYAVGEEECPF